MDSLLYRSILFDERNPDAEKLKEKAFPPESDPFSLEVCRGSYKTEMSLITGLPETEFGIEKGLVVVAITQDKKVIGFINIYISADNSPETICVGHVYVRPECRGKGIYKNMLCRLDKFAKDIGAKRIIAFVHRENGDSMKAHHKLGFKQQMVGYIREVK